MRAFDRAEKAAEPDIADKLRRAGRVTVTVAGQAVDDAGNKVSIKRAVLVRNR